MIDLDERLFFEVFPELKLPEPAAGYFQQVKVTKIVMFQGKKRIEIHISSEHLIDKSIILKAEEELKKYLYSSEKEFRVMIVERYHLSEQYNVEKLVRIYTDSFLCEIKNISNIDYRILKRAIWECNEQEIILYVEDSALAREHAGDIKKYLEDTMQDRFGYPVNVCIDFRKEQNTRLREESAHTLQLEVESVSQNYEQLSAENSESGKKDSNAGKSHSGGRKNRIGTTGRSKTWSRKKRPSDDPDCFYGRNCEGDAVDIRTLEENSGEVCIRGEIFKINSRELPNGKILYEVCITDRTDSIMFKLFIAPEEKEALDEELVVGWCYKLKGVPAYDHYAKDVIITNVIGLKRIPDYREKRMDNALEKRVELHLHTVMSDMDSVVDIKKVIQRAKEWGHKALAITDHGVVQAFPIANHEVKPDEDFKIIYGVEGYFVDDLKDLVMNEHGQMLDSEYIVFDIETTGLSPKFNKIIEIGAVRVDAEGKELGRFSQFVNPEVPIPYNIEKLTSISDSMVMNAPTIETVLPEFLKFCEGGILVAHNASFDTGFIKEFAKRQQLPYDLTALDTMTLAHIFLPELGKYTLDRLCKHFGFKNEHHHRACDDADVTAKIFVELLKMIRARGCESLADLNRLGSASADAVKKAKVYHGIILVQNEVGRVNLYRLISESHINYFNRRPRMPKSLISKYREGLIIGSACEAGELYQALLRGASDEEIARIVKFYDYLEIQPEGNNAFLLRQSDSPVKSVEDIRELNKRIVELGKIFQKPVVATCDVHFMDPEDAIYREIIMTGKGYEDAKYQPPLYYRTTEEMLSEFEYLGSDTAREVVVTNTNLIADRIEKISPVRPDKQPPVMENADQNLRDICYNRAHEIYGPNLPQLVEERLEKELTSIISNGFAVLYIIAQMLVDDSRNNGYLVGSRGSVGSSFVATMAGITEVNPLPAHYICPSCHYVDFDSELVKSFVGMSGCDMPDRNCPVCGTKLIKEGHDIPFETFLGFKGDKEPDIDLNFSGEYQARAHAFTEKTFGKGKAFRAGTIGTLAEKTAYGYVLKYCEEREITKRRVEMERLAAGCTGVKRTTGQHPGGMIVLPKHEEIYSFTPIQKPANDMSTDTITTHFEYHSIDHNLLKLDILGHDDPTMMRRLKDLTGFDPETVPLDDKAVMSLFHGTEALGIKPEDIGGTPLGSLGIPEFGTDFAMQMLIDADPQNFSDLVRIAGLAHGTDVWLGNAKTLIQEGKCVLSSAICCRDDIMIYLISMGLEKGLAFTIMESVRKGKGLKEEWEKEMLEHNVPDWYIWSCKKIQYMFPKAHAAAYVMMAWRIAYFKVHFPLEYYAAFLGIRASDISYEMMCMGKEKLEYFLNEYRKKDKNEMTAKEQGTLRDMRIVQEMYARGFEFEPIDIYEADDKKFKILDGKIMPSLSSIDGMGEKAAAQLKEEAAKAPFLSQDEIRTRAKISKTTVEKMAALGILSDLPETSQFSFQFE